MHTYKTQLRQVLANHGWEVTEVVQPDDWWADEFWKLESRKNAWGLPLVLTFLVDPMWDAPRKPGQGIWAIIATDQVPADRLSAEPGIAKLYLAKGRFDKNVLEFVTALDTYRNCGKA
ncbi:MAG TPA: hypothetical protein VE988_22175 [Gemmataceae bacterium]|nr:hypothetical protein [Gemmataceae bacterium]